MLLISLLPLVVYGFVGPPGAALSSRRAPVVVALERKKVAVGVVGPGLVGGELLAQIEATTELLAAQGLDVSVSAISELKDGKPWMICDGASTITTAAFRAALADPSPSAGQPGDFLAMADHLQSVSPHAVMFDTTASEIVSNMYAPWLAKGVHVVTPNKKVGSGGLGRWKECAAAMEASGAQWGDETTVGAGLPLLNVLRTDLLATGDEVKTIEGIFSGTLSYLFNEFKPVRRVQRRARARPRTAGLSPTRPPTARAPPLRLTGLAHASHRA